ncbi:hypothetical protein HDV00_005324 [Rhizophlyctis rosea]|nr:hypothetical protein HDV00_005324 [Rhizophlyctis rosea]
MKGTYKESLRHLQNLNDSSLLPGRLYRENNPANDHVILRLFFPATISSLTTVGIPSSSNPIPDPTSGSINPISGSSSSISTAAARGGNDRRVKGVAIGNLSADESGMMDCDDGEDSMEAEDWKDVREEEKEDVEGE